MKTKFFRLFANVSLGTILKSFALLILLVGMSGQVLLSADQAWAKTQTTRFTLALNSVKYRVGETKYTLNRIQEHQPHIQSVNINFLCPKSKVKQRYFYKFGMCQVESATLNTTSRALSIKYYSHDLSTGDEYLCERNAKFLEFVLEDKCLSK